MSEGTKKPFERLPTKVVPVHYTLHLTPDLKQFAFNGTVDIDVQVTSANLWCKHFTSCVV